MHIVDGILPVTLTVGGFAGSGVLVGLAVRWLAPASVPRVALLTAAFFVTSLIHVPVGGVSVHLLLHGLLGIVLGPLCVVAIAVGLAMQSVLLLHGGITALGINVLIMSFGAAVARTLFDALGGRNSPQRAGWVGVVAGAAAVCCSALATATALWLTGAAWVGLGEVVLVAHVPVAVIEGLVAGGAAAFFVRVKPELLTVTWSQDHVCSLHSTLTHR